MLYQILTLILLPQLVLGYDTNLGWDIETVTETRTIDEIYDAAIQEGGVVTLWYGGGLKNQQDGLKEAFERRFPQMRLNVTVDESKYLDGYLNQQLALGSLYVDSTMLQTLQNFPTWKRQGALMNYKPIGFDQIYEDFRGIDGAYYGVGVNAWSIVWNTEKTEEHIQFSNFNDFLRPELKGRIVLCYPNDDDAVLYSFDLILRQYGLDWWNRLLAQRPKWTRGAGTSVEMILAKDNNYTATFTTTVGLTPQPPLNLTYPTTGPYFTSWPQFGAIFKDAPHPESAKLLHNFILSHEYQKVTGTWSSRKDIAAPNQYPSIMDMAGTDPTKFKDWMRDRAAVEQLRNWFESQIGTPRGDNVPWGNGGNHC